jgi:RNA polymerase sigma-70 factor (ECF subfamily)
MSQTTPGLLHRLREAPANSDAWRQFDDIYRPLLSGWLRRYSLQTHDIDDLVQDVLEAVCRELPNFHYDPARGHFRGWLRQIMGNRLREFWRAQKREWAFVVPLLEQLQDPGSELTQRWDREHDQHVLQALLTQIEPEFVAKTWQAFRRVHAGERPKDAAAGLGLTMNAVFLARSRIRKRLRKVAEEMT